MTTLTYRGIQFETSNTTVETAKLGISGTYRGQKTSFSRSSSPTSNAGMRFLGKTSLAS